MRPYEENWEESVLTLTRTKRAFGKKACVLTVLCLLTALVGVLSVFFFEKEQPPQGEMYRAVLFLDARLQENRAISVFLGIDTEAQEKRERIEEKARAYVEEHNEKAAKH